MFDAGLGNYSFEMAGPLDWPEHTLPTDDLGVIRMSDIIAASCVAFDVTEAELKSGCRKRCMARARQVATFIAREHTGFSYPAIARMLGNIDHTTCIWGDRKIAAMIETDEEKIRAKVRMVRQMLREGKVREAYRQHFADRVVIPEPVAKVAAKRVANRALYEKRLQLREMGFLSGGMQ